jgi:hypothetical protein
MKRIIRHCVLQQNEISKSGVVWYRFSRGDGRIGVTLDIDQTVIWDCRLYS